MPTPTKRRGGPIGPAPTPCPSSPMNPPSVRARVRRAATGHDRLRPSPAIRLDLLLRSDCRARSLSPTLRGEGPSENAGLLAGSPLLQNGDHAMKTRLRIPHVLAV